MEPMLAAFERVASEVTYSSPRIDLISNVTGELATAEIATPEYWCRHVRQPVKFTAGMETLRGAGYEVFVEIGPKPTLLGMGRHCLPEGVGVWLPSLRQGQGDWQQILQSLGELYVRGMLVDWFGFDRDYPRQKVVLPTYPFQRQRYWVETASGGRQEALSLSQENAQTRIVNLLQQGDTKYLAQQLEKAGNFSATEAELLPKLLEVLVKQHQQQHIEIELGAKDEPTSEPQQPELLQRLEETPPSGRLALLLAHIQSEVATVLGLDPFQPPEPQQGFFQMGMDSLMAVQLKNRLEASLGHSLPSTLTFNYPTIETLAGYLTREAIALEPPEKSDAVFQKDDAELGMAGTKLEQLSEEEMEALLIQKLQTL